MAILTVQTTGVNDTYMASIDPTVNYGTDNGWAAGEDNTQVDQVSRALLKFDISSIPAGSTINSAILTLTYRSDLSSNARTLSVYRSLRAWIDTQATWNVYTTGNNWTSAGANDTTNDREATDIGNVTQPASPTLDTTVDITLTASKIQEMIAGGSFTNNGFVLRVDTETNDYISYHSTDGTTEAFRHKLVVTYIPPAGFFYLL